MKSLVLYKIQKEPKRPPALRPPTAAIETFAFQAGRIAMRLYGKSASAVVFVASLRWYLCGSIQIEDTVGRWHLIARSLCVASPLTSRQAAMQPRRKRILFAIS